MPSTREIRRRIRSIRNTAQITRAMEMVAASRMRRAQQAVTASRPFSEKIRHVLADLGASTGGGDSVMHPLLERRPENRVTLILMTSDRGLAGSFNTNIIRTAINFILDRQDQQVSVIAVGRKGRDYMVRRRRDLKAEFSNIGDLPGLEVITPVAYMVMDEFTSGQTDAVYLAYTEYISTLNQRPTLLKILPIEPPEVEEGRSNKVPDYIFEPNPAMLLKALLPRYVEVQLYQALLESKASEHSARMVAMRNATDNANELVDELTLTYNKLRQANITKEIIEIASGAAALEG